MKPPTTFVEAVTDDGIGKLAKPTHELFQRVP